jgi:hypothetical protein
MLRPLIQRSQISRPATSLARLRESEAACREAVGRVWALRRTMR